MNDSTCEYCGGPLKEGLCLRCLLGDMAEPPDMNPLTPAEKGAVLGDYELISVLARGGMGVVWRARQMTLGREVAVKLPGPAVAANPAMVRRFHDEAAAAAALSHPHIVPIHEFGDAAGEPFLSMKLIEGARPVSGAGLDARECVRTLLPVVKAVHFAHERGVLHRDLKPGNILVGADGHAWLTDFGLAKVLHSDSQLTLPRELIGTPAYMAPEQCRAGADLTTGVDVYALGAVLYEMLTGRPPFEGDSPLEVMRKVAGEDPPRPERDGKPLDRNLATICLKCLEKTSQNRYASAAALADDLEAWLDHRPITARPAGRIERLGKWVRRHPLAATLLALAALGMIAATAITAIINRRLATQAERQRQELVKFHVATGNQWIERGDSATALLYFTGALDLDSSDAARAEMHRLRLAAALADVPVLEHVWFFDRAVNTVRFSPDGSRLVIAGDDLCARIVNSGTGIEEAVLTHPAGVSTAAFSRNGEAILTTCDDGIARLWNPAANALRTEFGPVAVIPLKRPLNPASVLHPGGELVLARHGDRVTLRDTASGSDAAAPVSHRSEVVSAGFSADGARFFTAEQAGKVRLFDTVGARQTGEVQHRSKLRSAWLSPDGSRLLTVGMDAVAMLWNLESPSLSPMTLRHESTSLQISQAAFSPDGKLVLTSSYDNTVRTWDATTGELKQRTISHAGGIGTADFSPDSRLIVTASFDGTVRLWDAVSGLPAAAMLHHSGYVFFAGFSPDGSRVASAGQDGAVRLWRLNTNGAHSLNESGKAISLAKFSPNGERVLLCGLDGSIRLLQSNPGHATILTFKLSPDVTRAAFTPDGRRVAMAASDHRLHLHDTATGEAIVAPRQMAGGISSLAFSPDGAKLAVTTGTTLDPKKGTFLLLDALTLEGINVPVAANEAVLHVEFRADGSRMVTGGAFGSAQLWHSATATADGLPLQMPGAIRKICFSPDGCTLLAACDDLTYGRAAARLWDVKSRRAPGASLEHRDGVIDVVFSPDGRLAATGSEDSTARIWHADTGEPATPSLLHPNKVVHLAFDHTGLVLATGTNEGSVRLWDVATGEPLTKSISFGGPLAGFALRPGRRELLIAAMDSGRTEILRFVPRAETPARLWREARRLSAQELDSQGRLAPLREDDLQRIEREK